MDRGEVVDARRGEPESATATLGSGKESAPVSLGVVAVMNGCY